MSKDDIALFYKLILLLLRMMLAFIRRVHTFCALHKAWFKHLSPARVDIDAINYATKYNVLELNEINV